MQPKQEDLSTMEVLDDVKEHVDLDLIKIQRCFGENPIFEFFPQGTSFRECSYWRYCYAGERNINSWIINRKVNFQRNYELNFYDYFMRNLEKKPTAAKYLQMIYSSCRNL